MHIVDPRLLEIEATGRQKTEISITDSDCNNHSLVSAPERQLRMVQVEKTRIENFALALETE